MPQILPEEPTTAQATSVLLFTAFFFLFGAWALTGTPLTGWSVRGFFISHNNNLNEYKVVDTVLLDTHYKYFVPLFIPLTAYFVIANWVGWQYYRNS